MERNLETAKQKNDQNKRKILSFWFSFSETFNDCCCKLLARNTSRRRAQRLKFLESEIKVAQFARSLDGFTKAVNDYRSCPSKSEEKLSYQNNLISRKKSRKNLLIFQTQPVLWLCRLIFFLGKFRIFLQFQRLLKSHAPLSFDIAFRATCSGSQDFPVGPRVSTEIRWGCLSL